MPKYYCHDCASSLGLVSVASPANLTGNQYQLDKYIKHTMPTGNYPINSVFSDPTIQAYSSYIINTSASGCLEIDDQGRKNMVWFAGSPIGVTIQPGLPVVPNDTVMIVLPENASGLHAFPTGASHLRVQTCAACGKPIISPTIV